MGKWIALGLLVAGAALIAHAMGRDGTGFEDGSFIGLIAKVFAGLVLLAAGVGLFLVLLFGAL
jgi:hypothetical protein